MSGNKWQISDQLWERMAPLFPEHKTQHPLGTHRRRVDNHAAMNVIFFVLRTDCKWHALNATEDSSSSSHFSRVSVYRGNVYESTDFLSRNLTQFRNFSQQCSSGHGADAFNAAQSLREFFKVAPDVAIHFFIDSRKFILQYFDDDIYAFSALMVRRILPVTLSDQHCVQLPSSDYHCGDNLTFSIQKSPDKALPFWMEINDLSHLGKHPRINTISLRQISHSTSKITLVQFSNNRINTISVIGYRKLLNSATGSNVERCFGYINAQKEWIWLTHDYQSLQMCHGVRTTVRVSDEWLSVCASRLKRGFKQQGKSGCIRLAKSNRSYFNQLSRYKEEI